MSVFVEQLGGLPDLTSFTWVLATPDCHLATFAGTRFRDQTQAALHPQVHFTGSQLEKIFQIF